MFDIFEKKISGSLVGSNPYELKHETASVVVKSSHVSSKTKRLAGRSANEKVMFGDIGTWDVTYVSPVNVAKMIGKDICGLGINIVCIDKIMAAIPLGQIESTNSCKEASDPHQDELP